LEVLRARESAGGIDAARYEDRLRQAVTQAVRRQVEAGVDIVSDGEYGKGISWSRYALERLEGFEYLPNNLGLGSGEVVRESVDRARFRAFYEEYDRTQGFQGSVGAWVCTGPIRYQGHAALRRDIENLKVAATESGAPEAFLPVAAPGSVAADRVNEYYGSDEELLFAVADALHEEYRTILDAGLHLQVDDAHLPGMYERMVPPGSFDDYLRWADQRIEALNHALRGLPQDRIRYHVCWGSWNAPHTGDVPFERIVDLVLRVRATGNSVEQANPRHEHEWRVWERVKLPDDRVLLPGLVSHATNVVEHPELVAQRLTRLAGLVGRERVVASTDCGFAQGPFVRRVHPSIMWAKLEALAQGAWLASRQLWGAKASGSH
jgi:5-methyltetrahydropteroyltriglutamate--homocysteine methyltransferase